MKINAKRQKRKTKKCPACNIVMSVMNFPKGANRCYDCIENSNKTQL